ncbi:SDR family oxidoreductase [Anaerolentibacter hominis]|uniref:SDR family NAD(P)-dependent oxidoreductase n=1 Tax=Anaerolentibacter hominis TaxID=3079009 RepID=UPI0031B85466
MKMDLQGKRAVITGAGGGIGKSIALNLAAAGVNMVICGRNEKKLKDTAETGRAFGVKVIVCAGDLLEETYISSVIQTAKNELGGIDFLINNAGLAQSNPFQEISTELFDTILGTNVRAPFLMCKHALDELKASGLGTIINVCSVVAHKGYPYQAAYAASKHALYGLSKTIANELYKDNVRVHVICPGGVYTEMVKETRPDLDASGLMVPEDIADVVLYFLEHRNTNGVVDEINIHRPGKEPFA